MNARTPIYLLAVFALTLAPCALAQESHTESHAANAGQTSSSDHYASEDAHFFRLDFAVEERDGTRVVNRREYRMTVATNDSSSLRSGDRVPITTSDEKGVQQYQYVDMGVKFDVSGAELTGDSMAARIATDVSSMPDMKAPLMSEEIIRNHEWKSRVLLPLNKPTAVYTSDDAHSTHTLSVTVTPTLVR